MKSLMLILQMWPGLLIGQRETFRMLRHDDFTDYLKATKAATLVVAGRHDPILPLALLLEQIVSRIPSARLVQTDCGHEIPVEKPAEAASLSAR